MKKKFICTVCGYIHEGDAAPERCPLCKAPASKFKEMEESADLKFVTEHEIGVAKGCDEQMIHDLTAHFNGECTEVGMYLAMSRQADREGYPEIADEIEVENLDMLRQALEAGADIIMLDNMSVEDMKEAVRLTAGRAETECSGNVTKENIAKLVDIGVDYISSGALTHSSPILDLSLKNLHAI